MSFWWMQDETYPVEPAVTEGYIGTWDGSYTTDLILTPVQVSAISRAFGYIGTSLKEALLEVSRALDTIITTTAIPSDKPKDKNGRLIPPPQCTGPRPNRAFSHRGRKLI